MEEFLKTLRKPKETDKEKLKAYNDLVAGTNSKIFSIQEEAKQLEKFVREIKCRFDHPDSRNNILLVTHQILQSNTHARKMLLRATIELDRAVDELRNALLAKNEEDPQTSFKTCEVYNLICRQQSALKEEREELFCSAVSSRLCK